MLVTNYFTNNEVGIYMKFTTFDFFDEIKFNQMF